MRPLDRYRVLRSLGRGSFGGVFLVEDRVAGGPPVALKRLHSRPDELLRASFEREFVALASLSLPGVARVYDFGLAEPDGEDPGGPFFTRAYVEGEPLGDVAGGRSPEARAELVASVAAVVAPLHRMGVVHGDLKPANVIIDRDGSAHVIDFGLARLPGERSARGGTGSPAYMAPELLRGEPPSVRSDIYALGATLWAVMTGSIPHAERTMRERMTGLAAPDVPGGVDAATAAALAAARRALEPDPLARLPAVDELLAALEPVVPAARVRRAGGFVAPRPRGHAEVVARLDGAVAARTGSRAERNAVLVVAARGGGKTTLLRELKWRLQVRGLRVLETGARAGAPLSPIKSLLSQARVFADEAARIVDPLLGRLRAGDSVSESELCDGLAAALRPVAGRGALALLVDDLDEAEPLLGAALRAAMHFEGLERVVVVAAATDPGAPAVRELGTSERVEVPKLGEADVTALSREALGAVDASVVAALFRHSRGVPAALVEALAALSGREAPTAEDVGALPAGETGRATAIARLAGASAAVRPVLSTLAVASVPLPDAFLAAVTGAGEEMLERAVAAGVAVRTGEGLALADPALGAVLLSEEGPDATRARAAELLAHQAAAELPRTTRARLAIAGGRAAEERALIREAAAELAAHGANGAAAALSEALVGKLRGKEARELALSLAGLRHTLGRYEAAVESARAVLDDAASSPDERAEAAVAIARAFTAAGRYDDAVEALAGVPPAASAALRARVQRELAKVHLRRGDYDGVEAAVAVGLELAPAGDIVRIELLTSAGMVASYRGDHAGARSRYEEALELARKAGSKRDEANVLTFLAIDRQRLGELDVARDLYAKSLAIARELGDVGSMATFSLNIGAVRFELGEHAKAAQFYEAAARLARRAGRSSTDVMARTNLAHLHAYLGLYERAKSGAETSLRDAEASGLKLPAAEATHILGDLAARSGDVETALARYDDAVARYRTLGLAREVAEVHLDAAEALLDRDGPVDGSAAAARLAEARRVIDEEAVEDFRPRLRLLLARARATTGDVDGALPDLEAVVEAARTAKKRDVEWRALAELGRLNSLRGAEFVARRHDLSAMEVLESIATSLPREMREPFWQDPRRRDVRRRAGSPDPQVASTVAASSGLGSSLGIELTARPGPDTRWARLLDITKRLASEHDVDRLLERITDSAVELSGAERGLVLLLDEKGDLEPRLVRDPKGQDGSDPSVAFSRSIAEAVLIDGEPIVTVDARDDHRLSEYLSVHKLMLKSVAGLPIRGRSGPVGVLYLEHRMRRGRFKDDDLDLLLAFADQAAIAIENARLLSEVDKRRRELEVANRGLEAAKADVERVLIARTTELESIREELHIARDELRGGYDRHGIVGRSEPMRAVFAVIDRVRNTDVPLVIQGESGTGKELVARAVHYGGPRAKKPFIAINCAAIPEALLESELFGHVRGAFTGADRDRRGVLSQASGGTLFLDEVGDMPPKMQVDLLRVLQDGMVKPVGGETEEPVDVRIISASNKNLREMVSRAKFREDLYYRLNVVEVRLPPLRERPADIPLLCDHFLLVIAKREATPRKRISREALEKLMVHPLPGNVRQLEHVLLNACVMTEGDVIGPNDLAVSDDGAMAPVQMPAMSETRAATVSGARPPSPSRPPAQNFEDFKATEKQKILSALEQNGWNRARAAKALGIPRRTFYRRLREHDIL